jgi:protocatechuate 3,4-dioxygenase beta subunit
MKLLVVILLMFFSVPQAPQVAEKNAPSKASVVAKDEPGERLIVSGKVFGKDSKPLAGASIYVYQTDAKGLYTPGATNDNRNPRLRGYMRTDEQGRYEFETIKPGSYPNSTIPAHIHYVVHAQGYKERIFEIVFEGDKFITERIRNDAAREDSGFSIRTLDRDNQGALRCSQDIKLRQ